MSTNLKTSIQRELNALPEAKSEFKRKKSIYRVPMMLRQQNEDAFTPFLVSIGPFNRKNERVRPLEAHKLEYLRSFTKGSEANLESYLGIIKDNEAEIRECYGEHIDMDSDQFIQMVLIDSSFIIELFRMDAFVMPLNSWDLMRHDLLLVENQLPLFILMELYSTAYGVQNMPWPTGDGTTTNSSKTKTFTELACTFFRVDKSRLPTNEADVYCCHFVDLLIRIHIPELQSLQQRDNNKLHAYGEVLNTSVVLCPSAMSLYEAGVKFHAVDSSNLLDINFDEDTGILTIPKLIVYDSTKFWFRNLIVFEQCHYYPYNYLTDYFIFMDRLINTEEDVRLLADHGIIYHFMGSDKELACLINSLSTYAHSSRNYYYRTISIQLKTHCKKRWNKYRATLMHTYFKHPWASISVIYAIILLLLTIVQVVAGILAI